MTDAASASFGGLVDKVTMISTGAANPLEALAVLNRMRRAKRMKRCIRAASDAARDRHTAGGRRYKCLMVTLTYRDDVHWEPSHIRSFMKLITQRARRHGWDLSYQWVVELTKRNRPHYHVLLWARHDFFLAAPDTNGDWPHGLTNVEPERSRGKGANYITKLSAYITKGEAGESFPPHCRLFGVSRTDPGERLAAHRAGLPMWLSSQLQPGTTARRESFIGWVCRQTGEVFSTPWTVSLRCLADRTWALQLKESIA